MDTEVATPLWGHGYGSKRHIVDQERPDGRAYRTRRSYLSICSPSTENRASAVSLDEFSDDHDRDRYEMAGWTHAENVMRLKPCLRCCKKAGIDPATA